MSAKKKCKLIHGASISVPKPIDWTMCSLCQSVTSEVLHCPAKSRKASGVGAGYKTLGDNLTIFSEMKQQPIPVDISQLDDGTGIGNTLEAHEAQWHNSCRLKCSSSRIARLESTMCTSENLSEGQQSKSHYTRQGSSHIDGDLDQTRKNTCFFCDQPETKEQPLHDAMMPKVTARVKRCAIKLQDEKLIGKLSSGDLVALDARYHAKCLVKLYNASTRSGEDTNIGISDRVSHGLALAELIGFIEDTRNNDDNVAPVFRLADLIQLYSERLLDFGVEQSGRIHSTDLKIRLLANIPGLRAFKQGRNVMLSFEDDVGLALKEATLDDYDDEAICLAKAAQIVRRDMQQKTSTFTGSFGNNCQEEAIPQSLLALVSMIMDGTNIKNKDPDTFRQSALTVAQLLQFNSSTRRRASSTGIRHNTDKETPLPVYLGLLIHGQTRKRELVETLFHLGVSISYDRVLDISTNMATAAATQYEKDGVVCPLILRRHLFTTAAIDNIDHNPTSTTAHTSFHGTGISLFQNRATESDGTERERTPTENSGRIAHSSSHYSLPESYTNVKPVSLRTKEPVIPPTEDHPATNDILLKTALGDEHVWLEKTREQRSDNTQSTDDPISWSAYHGNRHTEHIEPSINSLLPLFQDDSKSIGMIRHSMDVVKQAVEFLNPGQVPVVTLDQPLFAIAKTIQWNWPELYGEDKFVVMLGGLHIEMAYISTIGDFLDGSGWTSALADADVTTPGKAESLLKSSHVKRARHVHIVTCSTLWILLHQAYDEYCQAESEPSSYEDWCTRQKEKCPQFKYWHTVMEMQLLLLIFVRSLREGNFQMYLASLSAIVPWFFALDHTHYCRWLPVHIRDMSTLEARLPDVAERRQCRFSQKVHVHRKRQTNRCDSTN